MRRSQLQSLPWRPVQSSTIARLAWTSAGFIEPMTNEALEKAMPTLGTLWVQFHGEGGPTVYSYSDVPFAKFLALGGATSVGGMHAKIIKDKFGYQRVEIEPDVSPTADALTTHELAVSDAIGDLSARIAALEALTQQTFNLIKAASRPRKYPGGQQ